jgi:hypothetical protein
VFSLIPFAGTRRQMADADWNAQRISQRLQFDFPQADTMSVAAAAIGRHQEASGPGIARFSHGEPPAANRVDREAGGIVIGTNTAAAASDPRALPDRRGVQGLLAALNL